jgi:hypothetical protein
MKKPAFKKLLAFLQYLKPSDIPQLRAMIASDVQKDQKALLAFLDYLCTFHPTFKDETRLTKTAIYEHLAAQGILPD